MTGPAKLGAALNEFITGAISELAGIRGELSQLRAEATVRGAFVRSQLDARASAQAELYRQFVLEGEKEEEKVLEVLRQAGEAEGEAIDRASGRVARLLTEVASHGWLTSETEKTQQDKTDFAFTDAERSALAVFSTSEQETMLGQDVATSLWAKGLLTPADSMNGRWKLTTLGVQKILMKEEPDASASPQD